MALSPAAAFLTGPGLQMESPRRWEAAVAARTAGNSLQGVVQWYVGCCELLLALNGFTQPWGKPEAVQQLLCSALR